MLLGLDLCSTARAYAPRPRVVLHDRGLCSLAQARAPWLSAGTGHWLATGVEVVSLGGQSPGRALFSPVNLCVSWMVSIVTEVTPGSRGLLESPAWSAC